MPKNLKPFIAGFLTCLFLTGAAAGVAAAGNDLSIQAVLSSSIKLKLNGKDWTPQNPVTGDYYKPIIYNGISYLPVKAVVEEAAGMPVEYESATRTIWIGGRNEVLNINDTAHYEDYYGTILTTDTGKLATPETIYRWGVTNDKDMSLQYFTFYLKPEGKYRKFRASFYLDGSSKADLVMNIRKDNLDGQVIKSLTLKPGETIGDVDVEIGGVSKLWIESEIRINHDTVKKIVVGDPIFYNGDLLNSMPGNDRN
jgi:hypothetical protein